VPPDFPAGFIGRDHRAATDLGAQGVVGRLCLPRRAMDRVDESAARDGETEAIAEQRHEPAKGEPVLLIEEHGQRDRLRAELHRSGAEGIGGLQRMAPLHATVTLPALADGDPKLVDHGALHRQVFLVLRDHALSPDGATTVRALRGQPRGVRHIHARRRPSMCLPAVGGARFASRPSGILFGQPTRERRGLAIRPAPRHLEFLLQPLVLTPETIAFDLRPLQILAESFDFPRLIIDDLSGVRRWRIRRAPRHDMLMPDSRAQYKKEMRISRELTR